MCVWIPICYFELTNIPTTYYHSFLNTPVLSAKSYFNVKYQFCQTLGCMQFFWIFGTSHVKIMKLINSKLPSDMSSGQNIKPSLKLLKRCQLCSKMYYLITVFMTTLTFLLVYNFGMELQSPVNIFQRLMVDGRNRVFMSINLRVWNNSTNLLTTENVVPSDIIFGILDTWLRLCTHMTFATIEMLYAILALTIWLSTKFFEQSVNMKKLEEPLNYEPELHNLIDKYEMLKRLSDDVNVLWSMALLTKILEVSLRITFLMNSMVASKDLVNISNAACSVAFPVIAVILSGEVFRKVVHSNILHRQLVYTIDIYYVGF